MRNLNYHCAAPQARCWTILKPDADGFFRGEILLEDQFPLGVKADFPLERDNSLPAAFCSLRPPYWRCAIVLRRIVKLYSWDSDFRGDLILARRFYEVGLLVLQQKRVGLRVYLHPLHLHKVPLRTISVTTAPNNSHPPPLWSRERGAGHLSATQQSPLPVPLT